MAQPLPRRRLLASRLRISSLLTRMIIFFYLKSQDNFFRLCLGRKQRSDWFCFVFNIHFLLSFTGTMLDPQSFVRHLHTDRENQTCHWGFDAAHWRSYVHISDAYYKKSNTKEATTTESSDSENRPMTPSSSSEEKPTVDRVQSLLDEIKKRFNHPKLTRKQVGLYDFSISI